MKQPKSQDILEQVVPALTAWAVGKLLKIGPAKGAMEDAGDRLDDQRRHVRKSLNRARRNALSNPVWLGAGVAAIAIGLVLIAKATRET